MKALTCLIRNRSRRHYLRIPTEKANMSSNQNIEVTWYIDDVTVSDGIRLFCVSLNGQGVTNNDLSNILMQNAAILLSDGINNILDEFERGNVELTGRAEDLRDKFESARALTRMARELRNQEL